MNETTLSPVPDNLRPYLTEIAERLWSGRAAVMIGAGFSKNATPNSASDSGFPDWSQLGDLFYEKIHGRKPDTQSKYLNVLKLADEVQAAFGRSALNQILRDAIPDYDYEPSPLHENLLTLPWSDVFTTNYDTLLERASNAVTSQRYDVIVNMEDLVYSKKPRIVKLHGSFPSDRPFIITEEDYRCYPEKSAPFVNTVRRALLENTLCLIGFSGDDPNFLQWIGWIRDNLGQQNSPKIYLVGLFSLSDAQKKLLERRNIVLVDLSEYPDINGDHYKALERFLDYLLSRKAEDNRLGWPENNEFLSPDQQSEKLAQLTELLSVWKKQRLLYPGWVVVPEDRRGPLWSFTQRWINYLSERDDISNFIHLEFAFELNWRMEKCLCPILSEQVAFFEAILDRYLPLSDMEMPPEQISAMNARELNRGDIRNMCHHLLLSMMRHYREQGLLEKWEAFREKIQQDMDNLSPEHKAGFHYECVLFFFFGLNLPELKKQLAEWPVNESLPFWEVKRAGLLAEIGQVEEAKNILENSLTNIRSKLNLKPITTDYSLVSQEGFVMLLLNYVQTSVGLTKGDGPESKKNQNEFFERWNALRQYKCDPQNELRMFERSLERPPVERAQVIRKKEFDIGRVTQTHHFNRWDSEALTAYNFLRFCEDAGIPFRIPGVTVVKKSAEGTLSRIADYSPYWAMVNMVRIEDAKVIDEIFDRASLSHVEITSADSLIAQYLKVLEQSVADIRSGNSFYGSNFGIVLAKVIPEILSRLCCKCSHDAKEKLLDFLLEVYQSEHRSNYGGIQNLTNRLLIAFPVQKRFALIPRLLDFPVLENLNPLEESEFINPFQFLSLDKELTKNWDKPTIPEEKIEALLGKALSNDANVREWVMLILVNLHDLGLLNPNQTDRLTDVIWMRRDEFGLPSETDFYKSVFLDLPHPPNVEPEPLFKNYIQNEQFPIQQNGAPLTGGHIPICEEIIHAKNYIEWSDEDICEIFDRLIEWWDSDKKYLRYGPTPFFSMADEFKARFACLVNVLAAVVAPNFNISEKNNRKETLQRLISELRDYGLYALRLESACIQIYPESREDVLERIENGMASDIPEFVFDSLEAILVMVKKIKSEEIEKDFSKILSTLGQIVRWRKNPGLPSALNRIAELITKHPWIFSDELERLTLIGLHHIAKDTATNAGGLDISEKLEIRESAAGLAYRLFEFYTEQSNSIPDVLNEWEAICQSDDEFAEIRNQWILQN